MTDLIDRQAALDAVRKQQTYKLFDGDEMLLIDMADAQTELMLLPSVDAQPGKHGRWERNNDGVYCSVCHLGWDFIRGVPRNAENFRYCPICGSRMDGEKDG